MSYTRRLTTSLGPGLAYVCRLWCTSSTADSGEAAWVCRSGDCKSSTKSLGATGTAEQQSDGCVGSTEKNHSYRPLRWTRQLSGSKEEVDRGGGIKAQIKSRHLTAHDDTTVNTRRHTINMLLRQAATDKRVQQSAALEKQFYSLTYLL